MSDNTLRPIWTPDDARQTAADAAKYTTEPGELVVDIVPVERRDSILNRTMAELDMLDDDDQYRVLTCRAGRHRGESKHQAMRPRRARRITRGIIAAAVVVLVLAVGALWASSRAGAETFVVCPSGLTGVASADTSCAFADNVRRSFYWQPSWTVVTTSPVTGKFYTMQCSRTYTDTSWTDPKRCFGVNDSGAVLVVYVA
jgi:hypothetical protein